MTPREQRAFNDGAQASGLGLGRDSNRCRNPRVRVAWFDGFDHNETLKLSARVTDAQRNESADFFRGLRQRFAGPSPAPAGAETTHMEKK